MYLVFFTIVNKRYMKTPQTNLNSFWKPINGKDMNQNTHKIIINIENCKVR